MACQSSTGDDPQAGDPADRQLSWLMTVLNGPADGITPATLKPHFGDAFLTQVPPEALATTLRDLATDLAPLTVSTKERRPNGVLVAIAVGRQEIHFRVTLVSPGATIDGLLLQPAPEADPRLADFAGVAERLKAFAPRAALLEASLDESGCHPRNALAADTPQPLASMFKLYVLGALVAGIERGEARWSEELAIHEEWKSLPSGELQDVPAGTALPLETYAAKMISISDNTATDHLIHRLGRERIEAQQAAMGHAQPALNVPFPTTRELFVTKLLLTPEERQAYLQASVTQRRRLLDEDYALRTPPPDLDQRLAAWTAPRQIESFEWFASAADLCRAFGALKAAGERPAGMPALRALSLNPGVPIDPSLFDYVGFKGGSEPGVFTSGWLLHRKADATWRVVVLMAADESRALPALPAGYLAVAAVRLAGRP